MGNSRNLSHTSSLPDRYDLYKKNLLDAMERNRKQLVFCLVVTFIWGLAAHGYVFSNSLISHDSLCEFVADEVENAWRIQMGRVFVPAYWTLVRGGITTPWLIGILSLFYIGMAVFFVTKIFNIQSRTLMVLASGILTTNISVTATAATYMHDFDPDMLAMLMAAFAVFLWKTYDKGFLYGMIPLCLSIGLYQSYMSLAITLILLYLIMQLLKGEEFNTAFKKGLKSIGMLIGGGVLYFLSTKVVSAISGVGLIEDNYHALDTVLTVPVLYTIYLIARGYVKTGYEILTVPSVYPQGVIFAVTVAMILIAGILILTRVFQKGTQVKVRVAILALIALLPIGMNIVYPLTGGASHDLMFYALWMVYLFVLLVAWWAVECSELLKHPIWRIGQRFVITLLVVVVLCGNIRLSNTVYLKKDLEKQANLSLFSRIVYEMENCEGYIAGETPVVFNGNPRAIQDTMPGFERAYELTGSEYWYVLGAADQGYYQAYFDYMLQNPAIMAEGGTWAQMQTHEDVAAMPCFPEEGSVRIVDGVMVVKLG